MKKRKILYLFPLAALILSGCTFEEAIANAKSFMSNYVVEPAKNFVNDLTGGEQKQEEKPAEQQKPSEGDKPSGETQKPQEHVHDYGMLVAAVEADCEHEGHKAYYHCEGCGKYFTEAKVETTLEALTIAALGHDYGQLIAEVPASCETDGVKAHYECSRCHQLFDANKQKVTQEELVIHAKGHNYGELVVAVEADCEHEGHAAYYHCAECGKYFTEAKAETTLEALTVAALGHDYGELVAEVPAECEKAGTAAHYECSRCHQLFDANKNKVSAEQLIIAPLGHTYGELVAAVDPTCTEGGHEAYYHCTECDKYFTSEKEATTLEALQIAALGHNMKEHAAVEAKCTEAGNSKYFECERCHKFFSDEEGQNEIAENSWVIPAKGHSPVKHDAVGNDCVTTGNSEYFECSECHRFFSDVACQNEIVEDSWVIPATGVHTFDETHEAVKTFATFTKKYYHCSVCDKLYIDGDEPGTYLEIADVSGARDDSQRQYGDDSFGTEENPFIIANPEDLILLKTRVNDDSVVDEIAQNDNFSGKFFSLAKDIDLDGVTGFTPIGNHDNRPFSGTFDGNNHTISNYTYSSSGGLGLFSRVTNGTVKNLKISNFNITGTAFRVTPFCGRAMNATFENIHVLSGTVSGTYQNSGLVGVIVTGSGATRIKNCSSAASVTSTASSNGTGGLVGAVVSGSLEIEDSVFTGTVESVSIGAAGIVGQIVNGTTTITNCTNRGSIHTTKEGCGGVLGYISTLTSAANVTITNCVNTGTVKADSGNGAGGIFGSNADNSTDAKGVPLVLTIDRCVNRGSVTGKQHVGGIGGLPRIMGSGSVIRNCTNFGNISSTDASGYVGGIVSRARIEISNNKCYAEAVFTCKTTVKLAKECASDGKGAGATPGFILTVVDGTGSFSGAELIYEYEIEESGVPNLYADDAEVYVWAWGGSVAGTGAWYSATKVADNKVSTIVPYDVTGMQLVRFASGTATPDWSANVWNQSADIALVTDTYSYSTTM